MRPTVLKLNRVRIFLYTRNCITKALLVWKWATTTVYVLTVWDVLGVDIVECFGVQGVLYLVGDSWLECRLW